MEASLVLIKPDGSTKEIPVSGEKRMVGRGEDCYVRIPVAEVSRHHCEIALDEEEDALVVRDLKSSNGTFVNGERVQERDLTPGDILTIGPAVFVVRLDGFPKEIDVNDALERGKVHSEDAPSASASAVSPKPPPKKDPEGSDFFDDFDFAGGDEGEEDKL